MTSHPDESSEDCTDWHNTYWGFCQEYLNHCFKDEWCLSPELSLQLHRGDWTVPQQLLVRTPKGSNRPTELLHQHSIFELRTTMPPLEDLTVINGMRVLTLSAAQRVCSESDFKAKSKEAYSFSALLNCSSSEPSPYVDRLKMMWETFREPIIKTCRWIPSSQLDDQVCLADVENRYVYDAFHSLSIEGYRVDPYMIDDVRNECWKPLDGNQDEHYLNVLAARGYWQAFQSVKKSLEDVLNGKNSVCAAEDDYDQWYRELFGPCVSVGIIPAESLAGYRNRPVFIRNSRHTPPSAEAVRDLMPALFELLKREESLAVRAILGHFLFAYIHPYVDGNGRMARFLMNLLLVAGGCPWLIVPVDCRERYLAALEAASVNQDIVPFAKFLDEQYGRPCL